MTSYLDFQFEEDSENYTFNEHSQTSHISFPSLTAASNVAGTSSENVSDIESIPFHLMLNINQTRENLEKIKYFSFNVSQFKENFDLLMLDASDSRHLLLTQSCMRVFERIKNLKMFLT